ncbi:MAG: hypothetical protein K2X25_13490 [Caulobacteraceae bacterium]|nr:hypothetical protein [Caulobacteraceae bacterium]
MQSQVQGAWTGWQGDTVVQLTNGSIWRQTQYFYQYLYRYRPKVIVDGNMMYVDGMRRAVRVQRIA